MSGNTDWHKALDGARRRRVYLFRHGAVDYFDSDGSVVSDTEQVKLNAFGRKQALSMRAMFERARIDRAICSGLPRTVETGEIVLGNRGLRLESDAGFSEIRELKGVPVGGYDVLSDVAFSHWRAPDPDARFLGGERYHDFYARIEAAIGKVVADMDWQDLALFAHGGTNAAILGWVTGLGLDAFGMLDQATCCLNVIDLDSDENGNLLRKTVRAVNVTAYDPVKQKRRTSDMEKLASRILNDRKD